jgi:hypothetical protein
MEILCFIVDRLNKAFAWARRQAGPFTLSGLSALLFTRQDGAVWGVEIVASGSVTRNVSGIYRV